MVYVSFVSHFLTTARVLRFGLTLDQLLGNFSFWKLSSCWFAVATDYFDRILRFRLASSFTKTGSRQVLKRD